MMVEAMQENRQQIRSKERVANHGEVFTSEREVKAMCDLVKPETERIDSRFLEPACGDGNFLVEVLSRKLAVVWRHYRRSAYDYERMSLLALGSLYGVDILEDNAASCRERLYGIWNEQYVRACASECNDETRRSARFILSRNIVCGNALTLCCVDRNQRDTHVPIIFSEWSFPRHDAMMRRKDYTFAQLLEEQLPSSGQTGKQMELTLDMDCEDQQDSQDGSRFIRQYITHYRRIADEL